MLTATILALVAAVLHAAWNLSVKQSVSDRFIALWGQFFIAGVLAAIVLAVGGGIPARGLVWAALSGLTHLPYCLLLARAYSIGDFSLAYPIARGGGALIAGLGGIALLSDQFRAVGVVGMVVVALGLIMLAGRAAPAEVIVALGVAVTIGIYSVVDAKGIRTTDTPLYAAASFVCITIATTVYAVGTGRSSEMVSRDAHPLAPLRDDGHRLRRDLRLGADRVPTRPSRLRHMPTRIECGDCSLRRLALPRRRTRRQTRRCCRVVVAGLLLLVLGR